MFKVFLCNIITKNRVGQAIKSPSLKIDYQAETIMRKRIKWFNKFNDRFLHEKTVIVSLLFLLVLLTFDSFFQKLPFSGYGLVLVTLLLIGFTTFATCHGIKWAITSNKPLHFCIGEKSKDEKWIKFLKECDKDLFRKLLNGFDCFESLKYPTNLNEQIRLLLKDIERDFIKSWYSEISQNPSFLFESHLILEEFFFKLVKKLKTVNVKNLISSILILYLNHLKEYKKSVKKTIGLTQDEKTKEKVDWSNKYRCIHPGSQNHQVLNHYVKKVTKVILKEFCPVEFSNSLECKILSGIIGRKIVRKCLLLLEDPDWINLKLIYLLNPKKHEELLRNRIYSVKERVSVVEEKEFQFKKPKSRGKRNLPSNLFESRRNLFDKNDFNRGENSSKGTGNGLDCPTGMIQKNSLTLPLSLSTGEMEERRGNISTALSDLISSTAGPLLPDNISVRYKALNKMWQSPVSEVKDLSESITNSFRKVFVNGTREGRKGLARSKSTDSLAVPEESDSRERKISVGEELFEGSGRADSNSTPPKKLKKLTKTHSFDDESLIVMADEPDGGISGQEKTTSSPPRQRDVSPVYEESEDFATTIAKLRFLLQQHESSSTQSDKSNLSDDFQPSSGKTNSSSIKSRSSKGDSFDTQMACEIPADGRIFDNVSIAKGELVTESGISHVVYSIQYDGIYMLKEDRGSGSEPEFVLQTTLVKRTFRDFLQLQAKLEGNNNLRAAMKGIKGPSKWLNAPSGSVWKPEEVTSSSRTLALETFLRQICSKVEISNSLELHEFLGYGQIRNDSLVKKDSAAATPSLQRIDKLLANKFTGVFNSIKTVLPSFDFDGTPATAFVATNDTLRGFQEQNLLQGLLNFRTKPDFVGVNLNFSAREQTGGESLADDIRHYVSQKSVENAVDVLDSNDWVSEVGECRFVSEATCVWEGSRDAFLEDELEPLDSWLPLSSLAFDILSELLQDSADDWLAKEPVVRLIKFAFGHWESRLGEETLSKLDWDRVFGSAIRLLRSALFQSQVRTRDLAEFDSGETKAVLKEVILDAMPGWIEGFVKPEGLDSAVSLFVDSFQNFRPNRDVLLRLMDILLFHSLSCRHLTANQP